MPSLFTFSDSKFPILPYAYILPFAYLVPSSLIKKKRYKCLNKSRFKRPKEVDSPSLNGCSYFGVCVMRSRDFSVRAWGICGAVSSILIAVNVIKDGGS